MTKLKHTLGRMLGRSTTGLERAYAPSLTLFDIDASLAELESAHLAAMDDLKPSYEAYKRDISPGSSAASLKFAGLVLAVCRIMRPQRVADFGSGYTSYVLRRYQRESNAGVEVTSVDDSGAWLDRTREFLSGQDLDVGRLYEWSEFAALEDYPFDLSVLDIRPIARRVEMLPKLMRALPERGVVLVDDVHKPHMEQPMLQLAEEHGWTCVSLRDATLDEYGRYAAAVGRRRS